MPERGAQKATMQMGRMGAEDPLTSAGRASRTLNRQSGGVPVALPPAAALQVNL